MTSSRTRRDSSKRRRPRMTSAVGLGSKKPGNGSNAAREVSGEVVEVFNGQETADWIIANSPPDMMDAIGTAIWNFKNNLDAGVPYELAMMTASAGFFTAYVGRDNPRLNYNKMMVSLSWLLASNFQEVGRRFYEEKVVQSLERHLHPGTAGKPEGDKSDE